MERRATGILVWCEQTVIEEIRATARYVSEVYEGALEEH